MECKFWLLAITLSSLYAVTRTDHISEMRAAEDSCMVKYPSITPEVLNELKEIRDFPKFQASHSEINVDENGVLHMENLKNFTVAISNQMMTHEQAHAAVNECSTVAVHEDKCERAGQFVICKLEQLKEFALHISKHEK